MFAERSLILLVTTSLLACVGDPTPPPPTETCTPGDQFETIEFSARRPDGICLDENRVSYEVDVCDWGDYFQEDRLCNFVASCFVDRTSGLCLYLPADCEVDPRNDPNIASCAELDACGQVNFWTDVCTEPDE